MSDDKQLSCFTVGERNRWQQDTFGRRKSIYNLNMSVSVLS